MPTISVIMPVHNSEKYLSEAMASILNQTCGDFEFIIIDDASADASWEMASRETDPRIILLKNERNMGVAASLNRGIQQARGRYIARMDSDDISHPERFAKQLRYLEEHPEVGVLGTGLQYIGAKSGTRINPASPEKNRVNLLFTSCLAHPSVMMRRELLGPSPYNPMWEGMEDYELWWRLSFKTGIANLPEVLLQYRIHEKQVTQTSSPGREKQHQQFRNQQLTELGGVFTEEMLPALVHFCLCPTPDSPEQVLALSNLFQEIERANMRLRHFPAAYLRQTFRGIINGLAAGLGLCSAIALACRSPYGSVPAVLMHKLRTLLAR